MPEQTYDYLIAPKASFDATADAIRAMNGSQASITWGQDGFADAIGDERRFSINEVALGTFPSNIVITANDIQGYRFSRVTSLVSVVADNITDMSGTRHYNVFQGCTNLVSVHFENLTTVGNTKDFLGGCTKLTNVYMPKLRGTGDYLFNGCTSLVNIALPSTTGGYRTFIGCSNLEKVDYGSDGNVGSTSLDMNTFTNCVKLTTLIMRKSTSLNKLANTNVFNNSPFASGKSGGTIYIPKVFYDHLGDGTSLDYKAATNWSVIDGYGTITWAQIEGSQYENYYADGTPIPTT